MNKTIQRLMADLVKECQKEGASCVVGVVNEGYPAEIITGGNALDVITILQIGMNTISESTGLPVKTLGKVISKGVIQESSLAYDA